VLRAVLGLSVLVLTLGLLPHGRAYADKEFVLVGTVDCGRTSGARCDIGVSVAVWTTDVSGYRQRVIVDLSWVQRQLDTYDQDDQISIEIRLMSEGTLQAISIVPPADPPPARRVGDDDVRVPESVGTPTPTVTVLATQTPTPTSTSTPAPTSTATATSSPGATPTSSPTATATSTFSPTPTATATATSTFTPTPTATPVLADLSVTKIDDSAARCGSDSACWTVTVTNAGPNPATNVTVQEAPVGFAFTEVDPSAGTSYNTGTNVWTIGTLGVGSSVTLQLSASFVDGLQTNCAEVLTSDQLDPDSTPNNGSSAEDDRACSSRINRL
jgi:uncharacterized repeat protein (TIGR01451 family)